MTARQPVLLLNASGEPLGFVPWTRALNMVIRGKVHVYEYYEGAEVRSQSQTFRVPAVMALTRYIVIPDGGRRVRLSKKNLLVRDSHSCQYCGEFVTGSRVTVDHVWPQREGGWHDWDNVVISCKPCNNRKRDRTPEQADMALRRQPWVPNRVLLLRQTARKIGYEGWRPYLGMA